MKYYSERFEGVLLWEGESGSNEVLDIKKTDAKIQEYLDCHLFQWLEENPGIEDSPNYEEEKIIIEQQHWIEVNDELSLPNSVLLVWTNRQEYEIKIMLRDTNLFDKVRFRIENKDDGEKVVIFSNNERCISLSMKDAHQILEDCALSMNVENYFWYLGYQKVQNILF